MQTRLLPALLLLLPVQYGLYVGELLRGKPAREQAQNGPDACAPLALPFWPQSPQPWGDRGHWCLQPLHPPPTAAAGTPAFRALPLQLGPGRALNRGGGSSASLQLGMAVAPEGAGLPVLSVSGELGPCHQADLDLGNSGQPPLALTLKLPLQVGGTCTRNKQAQYGGSPIPSLPSPLPRLSFQPSLYLPQTQPTLSPGPIFYVAWRSPAPPPRPFVTKDE